MPAVQHHLPVENMDFQVRPDTVVDGRPHTDIGNARYPVKAMDFVEVSPRIDPTGRSTLMATELLLGMLGPRLFTVRS